MMMTMLALLSAHTLDKDGAEMWEALRESEEAKGFVSRDRAVSSADDSDTIRDIRASGLAKGSSESSLSTASTTTPRACTAVSQSVWKMMGGEPDGTVTKEQAGKGIDQ